MTAAALPRIAGLAVALTAACASFGGTRKNDTFDARKQLARELVGREDWSAAFFYADQLHREDPGDAEVLVIRGVIYRERGLPAESEADLLEALKLDPKLADAHSSLGILYDWTGRGEKADAHHRKAIGFAPNHFPYLNNLGFSLFLRGRHREAVEVCQQAARLSPTNRKIRTNLGFAYAGTGDLARARREFEMGGTPAEAKNNLGFAYERRGDHAQAYEMYLEAFRLNPMSARARANLVFSAKKLGKPLPPEVSSMPAPAEEKSP